ncbi:MAG: UDP-N-acetylmuramoyl-tripeptide--D-alanyl-D-alanine ligase [Treponemataceae bacterium]|nr:UDP-N-acetylmuramoyl-tripeptide--D-alanyl-D-alanine ligase [Treponemataceae bacterium]
MTAESEQQESLLSAEELAAAVRGRFVGSGRRADFFFSSVATDSRNVRAGSLFVPLRGEFQDGHQYVPQAVGTGATVVFIDEQAYRTDGGLYDRLSAEHPALSIIVVERTLAALQDAAAAYAAHFPNLVKIAVTGSSGKTTSKEMIVSVLKQQFRVVATQGNFNSETGLPLSVFQIRKEHEVGVFEMGMNRRGEIAEITAVLKPELALVTNIGTAHIGILGSREQIAAEKRHVFDFIPADGAAFIPADDDFSAFLADGVAGQVVRFGASVPASESGVSFVRSCGLSGTICTVDGVEVAVPLPGRCNYADALGAIAVGRRLGVPAEKIKRGLESLAPVSNRMEAEQVVLKSGVQATLVRDFYNANPDSMAAAVELCASLEGSCRTILVLGDMRELGCESAALHERLGVLAARARPAFAIFIGPEMGAAYQAALREGLRSARHFPDCGGDAVSEAAACIAEQAESGDVILMKASRALALERIVPLIQK